MRERSAYREMAGPRPLPLALTARQRRVLERMVRRETSTQQQVRRAKAILLAEGANNAPVGRQVGVTRDTARLWRARWGAAAEALLAAEGEGDEAALEAVVLGVLADEPRPGAPATFTPEQLCQIMALACTPPGDAGGGGRPISQWTPRELADEAVHQGIVERISARTVGRFLVLGWGRAAAPPEPVLAHAGPRRAP